MEDHQSRSLLDPRTVFLVADEGWRTKAWNVPWNGGYDRAFSPWGFTAELAAWQTLSTYSDLVALTPCHTCSPKQTGIEGLVLVLAATNG